jgi:glutaconyl-CoA/methylmalonyl-CoA decarboxylase subunit gamma
MSVFRFKIFGNDFETRVLRRDQTEMVISVNGQEYKIYLEPTKERELAYPTPKLMRAPAVHGEGPKKSASPDEPKGAGVVRAPLPGLVLKVSVEPGQVVKKGQTVCVTEAMKMENNIPTAIDGVVDHVFVKAGDSILEGQELVRIRPA